MKPMDDLLNSITMYKTVLFGLFILFLLSIVFALVGAVNFPFWLLIASLSTLVITCFLANVVFARLYGVPRNEESYFITALILYFLFDPPTKGFVGLLPLILAGIIAMASKYVINIKGKHIFNPAALACVILGIAGFSVSWWVATPIMLPAVLVIGLLIVRKIRKFSLLVSFTVVVMIEMVIFGFLYNTTPIFILTQLLMSWPFVFFGTIMLTEPLTTPPTRYLQVLYGALVGFLFAFQLPLGPLTLSPEIALLFGNIFSYIVSSKQRLAIELSRIEKISPTLYNLYFRGKTALSYKAGQYVEWTLPHTKPDLRGNRRYFTIASSPTESELMLGIRTYEPGSSFKKALVNLKRGDKVIIGNLAGDFTLPEDKNEKLAFLAGGIGITPFRSIIKYLVDKKEHRDIILMHTCSHEEDFIYSDTFDRASKEIGLKIFCLLTHEKPSTAFKGSVGEMDKEVLKKSIPDYKYRKFYISGSNAMVNAYKDILKKLGVNPNKIITDYFSGY